MNYLWNAIKFSIKQPLLFLPLFICGTVLTHLTGYKDLMDLVQNIITKIDVNYAYLFNSDVILNIGSGISLALISQLVTIPLLYGLINKGLATGTVSLKDSRQAFEENLARYIRYCVGYSLISILVILFNMLMKLASIKIASADSSADITPVIISYIAAMLSFFAGILLSLWFAAMVVDNISVFNGLKKSLDLSSTFFGMLLTIFVLFVIFQVGSNSIINYLLPSDSKYPFAIIFTNMISTIKDTVLIVFFLMLYRGETKRKILKVKPLAG